MTQIEFLKRLEELLMAIPGEEREAALLYYDDYFQDAGPKSIEEVIKELGSPEEVAEIIIGNMQDFEEGEYVEYNRKEETYREDHNQGQQAYKPYESHRNDNNKDNKKNNKNLYYIIPLIILAIPFSLILLAPVLGIILGILGGLFGVYVGITVVSIVFIILAIILFFVGMFNLFIYPSAGILLVGISLIILSFGILASMFVIFITIRIIPLIVKGTVNLVQIPFKKKETSHEKIL